MLKVMIVDDDYLVRQGIIRVLPWEQYGMKVVCEASNGLEALELLAEQPIDLLVTDLAMPVMSGLELIKQVKETYPFIHMVVLTFHHEFDLVRDALRLGVLDYITKVELEDDQMASVLQRITERISEQTAVQSESMSIEDSVHFSVDAVETMFLWQGERKTWQIIDHPTAHLDAGRLSSNSAHHPFDRVRVRWHGVKGTAKSVFLQQLNLYGELELFYCYDGKSPTYDLPFERLTEAAHASKERLAQIGRRWSGLSWLTNDALFTELLEQTAALKLPPAHLEQMMYLAMDEWGHRVDQEQLQPLENRRPSAWNDWTTWLQNVRFAFQVQANAYGYSSEIVTSIFKAVDHVKKKMKHDLQLPDIAREVGMSRSYFSRCFRDITGKTFQDYVRDLRIEQAKKLLRHTKRSISWIAAESGYPNERYFSRVFRELTGTLPRDYRRQHLNASKMS